MKLLILLFIAGASAVEFCYLCLPGPRTDCMDPSQWEVENCTFFFSEPTMCVAYPKDFRGRRYCLPALHCKKDIYGKCCSENYCNNDQPPITTTPPSNSANILFDFFCFFLYVILLAFIIILTRF